MEIFFIKFSMEGHGAGAPPGLQNQGHGERPAGGLPLEGAMVGSIPTAPLQKGHIDMGN